MEEDENPHCKSASLSVIIWHRDCKCGDKRNPKMKLPIKRISTALFLFCFTLLSLSLALTQRQKRIQELQHEVAVTLKLIQVYVTDKKGNPVVDLKKEDFIIHDNGKEKPITEFERHILSFPSIEEKVQPEIIQESKLPAPRELMNRKFFLFFDFAYNNPQGILKAKKAALHFIDTKLQPLDEVGVLSYSAIKSLKIHMNLTTDHERVRKVVESFGLKDIHGQADGSYKESLLQAANFALKMKDLAKALGYIPGNKHIILFSSGIPYSMIYRQFISPEESMTRLRYEDMLTELAASNSMIYTLNTEALETVEDLRTRGVFTMQTISSSTGGKYFGNINIYEKHLEKIQNLTGCYYILGYYINEKWDGKYHKIKVKVNIPDCEVHAQKGYFNPKPFSEYSKTEKMLHLVNLALEEKPFFMAPIRFSLAALPCLVKGKPNLALFSKISEGKIQEFSGKNVEIVTIIFDKEDNIVKTKRDEKDFSKLPIGNIYYSTLLPLDSGEYKCRIVIRNLETGRGAVASSSVEVLKSPDSGIQLYSPLLLKPEKNAYYLKKPSSAYSFDSSQYSPLIEELTRGANRIWAVVRCSFSGIQQPNIQLTANLIHLIADTKRTIPVIISTLNRYQEDDTEIFLIELQTEELQSGEYSLNFSAEDMYTQSQSQVNTTFKVK